MRMREEVYWGRYVDDEHADRRSVAKTLRRMAGDAFGDWCARNGYACIENIHEVPPEWSFEKRAWWFMWRGTPVK